MFGFIYNKVLISVTKVLIRISDSVMKVRLAVTIVRIRYESSKYFDNRIYATNSVHYGLTSIVHIRRFQKTDVFHNRQDQQ